MPGTGTLKNLLFQFLLGRLETYSQSSSGAISASFQFLLGRLETPHWRSDIQHSCQRFQFLLGRLETGKLAGGRRGAITGFNSS